jgi:hypothetical protein
MVLEGESSEHVIGALPLEMQPNTRAVQTEVFKLGA